MTICLKCKHCKYPAGPASVDSDYLECSVNALSRNFVTGEINCARCLDINTDGNCPKYEERVSPVLTLQEPDSDPKHEAQVNAWISLFGGKR
jgi:hypothetical protein